MAGSLGLGIGFEEHHVENIRQGHGWDSDLCDAGTWDPDCGCCCQIFPPAVVYQDDDWTLMWGVDADGNIYPEDQLLLSADGYWEVSDGTNVIPVSVTGCDMINPAGHGVTNCGSLGVISC